MFYLQLMIPDYFLIGVLVYLVAKEFREWIELIVSYTDDNKAEQPQEPMPENVKHMYS